MRNSKILSLILICLFSMSCSVNRIAINLVGKFLENGTTVLYTEENLSIAKSFIANNIKTLEVLLSRNPENKKINLLLCQALCAYAVGFVEDEDTLAAVKLYRRAFQHALKSLPEKLHFDENTKLSQLEEILKAYTRKDVPALFWTGYSWGNLIMHNLDNPQNLLNLAKVEKIMNRVEQLNPEYNNASVYLFYGVYYCAKPVMFGGNPEKGKEYFLKCINLNGDDYLTPRVYMARYYAVQIQDRDMFVKLLTEVIKKDTHTPEYRLLNAIAKKKAHFLIKKINSFFLEDVYE